jgi:hypothetical protein
MKLACFCGFLWLASSTFVLAQFQVPVSTRMNTPYGPVTTTTYHNMPMFYGGGVTSNKYAFTIILKNDSVIVTKTKIELGKVHSVKVKRKGEKIEIKPEDTKELARLTYSGAVLKGIPADSCWLFRCGKGKINTYSSLAEEGTGYTVAIQDGENGPIVPLNKKNLENMIPVGSDEKIMKLIEKGKLVKAIDAYNNEVAGK